MAESLPLPDTIKTTADLIWKNRTSIGLIVVIAAIVKSTTTWLAFNVMEPIEAAWLHKIVSIFVYTLLAINVHRLMLNADNPLILNRWTMRETRFLGWLILIYLYFALMFAGIGIVMLPLSGEALDLFDRSWLAVLIFFLLSLPGAYLCVRLSVLLPATAMDKRQDMGWAWALTKGNGWRLVALLWVLPFLYSLLMPDWRTDSPIFYLVTNVAISAITALEVALLSAAFKILGGLTFIVLPQEQPVGS